MRPVCLLILSHAPASRKSPFLSSVFVRVFLPTRLRKLCFLPLFICLSPFCVQSKGEAGRRYPSLPYPFYSFFFFHPNKPHQLFFPLPTRLFTIAPCCLLSPDLLSFIDHVYDMTGTPLSLFFSRLLKGQEMIRVGGEENTSLH
jgi:hypothetical protein